MSAPTGPIRCSCGFWKNIEHVCPETQNVVKPGTRPAIPSKRCIGCNTLHGHLAHDCAQRDALLAKNFVAEPATLEIAKAQWAQGWRPPTYCLNCPDLLKPCVGCYVRGGYKAENYEKQFA